MLSLSTKIGENGEVLPRWKRTRAKGKCTVRCGRETCVGTCGDVCGDNDDTKIHKFNAWQLPANPGQHLFEELKLRFRTTCSLKLEAILV